MKKIALMAMTTLFFTMGAYAHDHASYSAPQSKTQKYSFTYTEAMKSTMMIVQSINHYPSAEQKTQLAENIDAMDSSLEGVALAETMAVVKNLQHFPSFADREKLKKLSDSLLEHDGDPNLIELIQVIGRVEHKVSSDDSAKLAELIDSY